MSVFSLFENLVEKKNWIIILVTMIWQNVWVNIEKMYVYFSFWILFVIQGIQKIWLKYREVHMSHTHLHTYFKHSRNEATFEPCGLWFSMLTYRSNSPSNHSKFNADRCLFQTCCCSHMQVSRSSVQWTFHQLGGNYA